MKKLSNINESVWGDMRKRAEGFDDRKEDKVNLNNLDMKNFKDYLESHYEPTGDFDNYLSYNQIFTTVSILAFGVEDSIGMSYFHLSLHKNVADYTLSINRTAQLLNIFELLKKEYVMEDSKHSWDYVIKPKKGEVDKKFFIEVLKFILSNTQPPEKNTVKEK